MSIPVPTVDIDALLASYPHVARCPQCREYVADYLAGHSPHAVLAAVLDHHDSAHSSDRLGPRAATF